MQHNLNATTTLLGLAAFFFFSTSDAMARVLMQSEVSQQQVLAGMILIALIPLLALVARDRAFEQLKPSHPGLVAGVTLIAVVEIYFCFYTFGHLRYLVEAYALLFTMPLWTALMAALLLKEHLSRPQIIAILIGFAGVLVANWPQEGMSPLGFAHFAGLAAPFLASLRILAMRKLGQKDGGYSLLICLFLGLAASNAVSMPSYAPLNGQAIAILLIAGLAQGCGYCSFLLAARQAAAPLLAPFQYSQVLWALIFGVLIFNEWPNANTYAGLALVVAGGAMLLKKNRNTG